MWWLRLGISVGLLTWLCSSVDWGQMAALSRNVYGGWIIPALFLNVTGRFLTTCKWTVLLRSKDLSYPFSYLLRMVWISTFFGNFLPSGVGADSVRMLAVARGNHKAPEIVSTVVVERLTGVMSLALLAVLGGLLSYRQWGKPQLIMALLLPGAALFVGLSLLWTRPGNLLLSLLLNRFRRIPGFTFLTKVYEAIRAYRYQPRPLLLSLVISGVIQLARVSVIYLLARALGIALLFGEALVLVPTVFFLTLLPISVGYLGVQEGAFVVLLGLAGIETSAAFGLSLLFRLLNTAVDLIGAGMFLTHGLKQPRFSTALAKEQV